MRLVNEHAYDLLCIGQHFVMLEMTLVAAMLLQRYRLVLPAEAKPCEPVLNVTLRPRGGLPLWLHRAQACRSSPGA